MAMQRFLMCPPDNFQVAYAINPWMKGNLGRTSTTRARKQFDGLVAALEQAGGSLCFLEPKEALPDQVFTANVAALVGAHALVSRFAYEQRRPEAEHAASWLQGNGFTTHRLPDGLALEGTGDLLRDFERPLIWAGYGWRSSLLAHRHAAEALDYEIVTLRLANPRFYHLDVCLAPLPYGNVMYFPAAFDDAGLQQIEARVPQDKRLIISERDALNFACNAIPCGRSVLLYQASAQLKDALAARGLETVEVPLDEFLLAGGSARCMVLPLDEPRLPGASAAHGLKERLLHLEGHLLDFSVLARCLDHITAEGCEFEVLEFRPGLRSSDLSRAQLRIVAPHQEVLESVAHWVTEVAQRSAALTGSSA